MKAPFNVQIGEDAEVLVIRDKLQIPACQGEWGAANGLVANKSSQHISQPDNQRQVLNALPNAPLLPECRAAAPVFLQREQRHRRT